MTFERNQGVREKIAESFLHKDVAAAYRYRPPYPPELLDFLPSIPEGHSRALDLGCGTGKISIPLSARFAEVVAVDPSREMVSEGKKAAGSSIHWMDQEALFPRLSAMTDNIAIISGDSPSEPPCGKDEWWAFLARWLSRMVELDSERWKPYDPRGVQ